MTTTSEPITWNRTVYRGTDHEWLLRRIDENDVPIVPTSGAAQIRNRFGGDLWASAIVTIAPVTGWVHIVIPESATTDSAWDSRKEGVWDLEVVVAGRKLRWAMGKVKVSQDVTRA
jgi:hypothetical protein